jgi:hypothetical protein
MCFKLEFYRGIKAIAKFLDLHPATAQKLLKEGKIPAKKDAAGAWVLTNRDYFMSLQG